MQTPEEPDDSRWNELLASADPMSDCGSEFDEAIGRLRSHLSQLSQLPSNAAVTNDSVKKAVKVWTTPIVWWTTAALALIALGATIAQVWKNSEPDPSINLVESKDERNSETENAAANDSTQTPTLSPDHAVTVPGAVKKPNAPVEKRGQEKIRSVHELLKLTPSQLAKVQRRLDQAKLDEELLKWLGLWHEASPEQRSDLEQQWVAHRGFWTGWTLRGLQQWKDPAALRAGIEILSLELGPSAPEQLGFCMQRIETASLALPFLLPRANETQLASWLAEAKDSGTAQAVIHELAGRPGQVATEALALLAADQVCQQLLREAALKWHPAHAQRAMAQLNSSNSQQQFFAAMILAVIDQEGLDQELLTKARSGVQALPALSAYVFRHHDQLAEKLRPLQQSPSAMAAIPSAQHRSQKWQRQQRIESPGPKSLRKVCQLCVTAS
ncbi:MAG: hypothetical protein Q8M16_22860 [Pirellulaceae bacterium]|nr:hypothetical protein [Pirellulaceae bacterium]